MKLLRLFCQHLPKKKKQNNHLERSFPKASRIIQEENKDSFSSACPSQRFYDRVHHFHHTFCSSTTFLTHFLFSFLGREKEQHDVKCHKDNRDSSAEKLRPPDTLEHSKTNVWVQDPVPLDQSYLHDCDPGLKSIQTTLYSYNKYISDLIFQH